jgi:hypothetical protein
MTMVDKFKLPTAADTAGADGADEKQYISDLIASMKREGVRSFKMPGGAESVAPANRPPYPVEVEVDGDGNVVVSDRWGVAYGVAATGPEAFVMWEEIARETYAELAAEEASLHPRLHEQLLVLRKLFG